MYHQFIPLHSRDYLNKISIKINVASSEAIAEIKLDTEREIKLEWLYKVGSECELNSWPDGSVG